MPYSSNVFDTDFQRIIRHFDVQTHLDIGAGAGKYGHLVMQVHPNSHRTAYEIYAPYLGQFSLTQWYQSVRRADAMTLLDTPGVSFDLVTIGDAIEHLRKSDGLDLIHFLVYRSKAIWVQFPMEYLQDDVNGNRYEAHISVWSEKDFEPFDFIPLIAGDMVGILIRGFRNRYRDFYARAYGLTDAWSTGIPQARALELKERYNITTFVETGIWHGGTTNWAIDHFGEIYTIDIDPLWVSHARNRFKSDNVVVQYGDSAFMLGTIIDRYKLTDPTMFWLDAHYIADKRSAGDPDFCPLINELDAIARTEVGHIVLIDDANLLLERHPDYLSWPTLDDVRRRLPHHTVTVEGNVVVCVPKEPAHAAT